MRTGLFARMRTGGRAWFNTGLQRTPDAEQAYRFGGWLLGQCFANRASLRIALPDMLFEKLLKGPSFQARAQMECWAPASECHSHSREDE